MSIPMSHDTRLCGHKPRLSERERERLRNAAARRELERRRDDKALHRHLTDVWDEVV